MKDLELEKDTHICNLGRGGFFMTLNKTFPSVGSHIQFDFIFSAEKDIPIKGAGIVRWVRRESTKEKPTGCGIEFLFLEPESRRLITEFINAEKTNSFIPKK